jgi:hypothetical protein
MVVTEVDAVPVPRAVMADRLKRRKHSDFLLKHHDNLATIGAKLGDDIHDGGVSEQVVDRDRRRDCDLDRLEHARSMNENGNLFHN